MSDVLQFAIAGVLFVLAGFGTMTLFVAGVALSKGYRAIREWNRR